MSSWIGDKTGIRRFSLCCLFLTVLSSVGCASARKESFSNPPETAVDVSRHLEGFRNGAKLDPSKLESVFDASRRKLGFDRIVIVPSLLSDPLMPVRDAGLVDYFSSLEKWMGKRAVAVDIAEINSEAGIEENAASIRELLSELDEKVCFVTHSKGGLDLLQALIEADEAALNKIACWVALQAPFAGSPVADWVTDRWLLPHLVNVPLAVLGGDIKTIEQLRTDIRHNYLARHDADIRRLNAYLPIVSLGTEIDPDAFGLVPRATVLWTLRQIHGAGVASDGIVPTASAILPYSRYVVVERMDHGMTSGLGIFADKAESVALIVALVALAGQ